MELSLHSPLRLRGVVFNQAQGQVNISHLYISLSLSHSGSETKTATLHTEICQANLSLVRVGASYGAQTQLFTTLQTAR